MKGDPSPPAPGLHSLFGVLCFVLKFFTAAFDIFSRAFNCVAPDKRAVRQQRQYRHQLFHVSLH